MTQLQTRTRLLMITFFPLNVEEVVMEKILIRTSIGLWIIVLMLAIALGVMGAYSGTPDPWGPVAMFMVLTIVLAVIIWVSKKPELIFTIVFGSIVLLAILSWGGIENVARAIEARQPPDTFVTISGDDSGQVLHDKLETEFVPDVEKLGKSFLWPLYLGTIIAFAIMAATRQFVGIQVAFFVVFAVMTAIGYFNQPALPNYDEKTQQVAWMLFAWGAAKVEFWRWIHFIIGTVLDLMSKAAGASARLLKSPLPIILVTALTWGISSVVLSTISPGDVQLYLVNKSALDTPLTVTLALEIIWAGALTRMAVSGLWYSLRSIVMKLLRL